MADEDIQTTGAAADDEDGGDAQVAGLPPYVDAIIQGYGQQFGRVISRKLVRSKDATKDRDRLVVTYENGQSQRKAVTFRIGNEGRPADPADKTDTGKPAETTIVESVEDVKGPTARTATPRTPEQQRSDAATATANETKAKDLQREQAERERNAALPASQDPMYETDAERAKRAQERIKQQGLDANTAADNARADAIAAGQNTKIQDDGKGGVVAIVTDKNGNVTTKPVPGVAGKPNQVTLDGTVYEKGPDGKWAPIVGAGAMEPLPAGVAPYKPDYSQPDLGLTARRDQLEQARRDGQITAAQAIAALKSDAALADVTRVHGDEQAQTIATVHGQQVTERGQDIHDQENRRDNATNVYKTAFDGINSGASKMGRGGGNAAAAAFMEALQIGLQNADKWGGMKQVPNTDIGTIKMTKGADGSVKIEVPHQMTPSNPAAGDPTGAGAVQADAAAQGEADAQQQAAQARGSAPPPIFAPQAPVNLPPAYHGAGGQTPVDQPAWMPSTGDPSNPTNEVNPGAVGQVPDWLQVARSQPIQWDPTQTIAKLNADPRVSKEVIAQALAELQQAA